MKLVYFAQAASGGPIKIGVSRDPVRRVRALSIGSPDAIELLATLPGGVWLEGKLHEYFADYRLHGEWFDEDTPALSELIEAAIDPRYEDPDFRGIVSKLRGAAV